MSKLNEIPIEVDKLTEDMLMYGVDNSGTPTEVKLNISKSVGIYQPTIPVVMVGGIITLSPNNNELSLFRPRLSVGVRTINTNFNLWFANLAGSVDIHAQFVFTGTIIITFQPGYVNVVEEELPTGYTWDAGLQQLTVESGTNAKREFSFLVDPDNSNTLTLRAGGVAV